MSLNGVRTGMEHCPAKSRSIHWEPLRGHKKYIEVGTINHQSRIFECPVEVKMIPIRVSIILALELCEVICLSHEYLWDFVKNIEKIISTKYIGSLMGRFYDSR